MKRSVILLDEIRTFLIDKVYSDINQLDVDNRKLKKIFREYCKKGYFNIYTPKEYGGVELSHNEKMEFQEIMGRWGGAFAFLQVQSTTASWLIQQSGNSELRKRYFSSIITGKGLSKNNLPLF